MSRVVVAMSGGVDSTVAAALLRRAGHEVIGLFMRHGETVEETCAVEAPATALPVVAERASHKQGCCSASDAADARRAADRLDVPFYAINFAEDFGRIMDYFAGEYVAGRTPNPCVVCNTWLKFGRLADYADSVGAEYIATGHYARLRTFPGERWPALCRGVDTAKDQSYVLFGIDRAILSRLMFPVGDYAKPTIRELARELGLRVADKPDSQEICFVPDNDHAGFVRRRLSADTSGEIVTVEGDVVGRHHGIEGFTIGQRKGLGVALGEPRYVVRLEADARRVVIGTHEQLARREFTASEANWLVDEPAEPFRATVKIRYQNRPAPALVTPLAERRLSVVLDDPATGVAPGQAVVCYADDRVLGGGWID
jgi:tRNA-specific 2-thiouridylase